MVFPPIPACMKSFVFGKTLNTGLTSICVLNILVVCTQAFIDFILCPHRAVDVITIGFYVFLALFVIIFILSLFGDTIPGIVHFICIIVWCLMTIASILALVTVIRSLLSDGTQLCPAELYFDVVMSFIQVVVLLFGIPVYWSFYVEIVKQLEGRRIQ
ncbi:hypothetical protein M8J76_012658 [Diaphorina citri]|nr:hypothetical protein M8J76_012658 [Diaphorina citri]